MAVVLLSLTPPLTSIGLVVGGVWGLGEGVNRVEGTSTRLRMTTVVNGVTRRGPLMANNLAVLGQHHLHYLYTFICIRCI